MTTASPLTASRIYYVSPLMLSGRDRWLEVFDHAAFLGFDSVLTGPPFRRKAESLFSTVDYRVLDQSLALEGTAEEELAALAGQAESRGIKFMLDLVISGETAQGNPGLLSLDPRGSPVMPLTGHVPLGDVRAWQERLSRLTAAGISGYRVVGLDRLAADQWQELIAASGKPAA